MTMRRMGYVAVVGWLALLPSGSPAQDAVDASSLRLRWDVDPPAQGLQTVCGRVFNDQQMAARRVRVRVEGLDERGEVTRRRDGDVLGQISSRSAGLFCVSMAAGAATYRVTVVSVDWVAETQSP
ncbi:MAG TPA: hypothetical protein VKN16_12715 [Methylomirabilota bacterium]|jgi:hypothetical protein|nr:hypothetical protein [Methylomirabilota bacterium]